MTCAEIRDLLGNYMDGELTDAMMQRIEKHLIRCAGCAYEARSIEQARDLLRQGVDAPMMSEALGERILRQVAQHFPHLQRSDQSDQTLSLPLLLEE